jgi:hypothetical protein
LTQLSKVTPEQQSKAARLNHRDFIHQVLSGEVVPTVFPYGNYEGDIDSQPIPSPSSSSDSSSDFGNSYGSSGPA